MNRKRRLFRKLERKGRDGMRLFFRYLLTGKDNRTYEISRFLLFLGVVSFLVFSAYDVFSTQRFDAINFSTGLTGLLFGGAGGIAVKANAEPKDKDDSA